MTIGENDNILDNFGGISKNSLLDIIDSVNKDDEEPNLFELSMYIDNDALMNTLEEKKDVFKVLSLNCQSLCAKHDQLYVFVEVLNNNGIKFDAICLQETWVGENFDTNFLDLPGYELVSKPKTCSLHGGLAIYVRENLNYKIILSNINNYSTWEHQFIEIIPDESNPIKIIIGNIYRLPKETNNDYDMFIDELSHVLNNFESDAKDVVLFGDYNIDLLKMLDKPKVNEFFELMLSRGYIPKITLPTRIQTSATLIDNAFCKISRNFSSSLSRILTSNISDHQAYFVCFEYLHGKK